MMEWFDDFKRKFRAGRAHAFILHHNIHDWMIRHTPLPMVLEAAFRDWDIRVRYNRAEGIVFAAESMKARAAEVTGINFDDPALALPIRALAALERLLAHVPEDRQDNPGRFCMAVIEHAETIVPDVEYAMMSPEDRTVLTMLLGISRSWRIDHAGNVLFLLADHLGDISQAVRAASGKVEPVEIPLPGLEERMEYIEYLRAENGVMWDISTRELAQLTAGLPRMAIQDIKLLAEAQDVPVTRELAKERKDEIIAGEFGEVIEIMDPTFEMAHIGGHSIAKQFFKKSVITPMREGNTRRVPQGVLLLGPPGTGKTALVEAVAHEAGINCVNLRLSRILGQYVGNSERNLERALQCIRTLVPTIVFLDEIDQVINRGESGDSGVSNRLFSRLMEFASETANRGKVLIIGASNRPDLLDPAFKRAGRFDKKVPLLLPDEDERVEILIAILNRHDMEIEGADDIPDELRFEERTDGYTGAEIETVVMKAYEYASDDGRQKLLTSDLDRALDAIRPSTQEIEHMTLLAIREVSDRDLLPKQYWHFLEDKAGLQAQIQETNPFEPVRRKKEI